MKLLYAFTVAFFLSASAFVYFTNPSSSYIKFLSPSEKPVIPQADPSGNNQQLPAGNQSKANKQQTVPAFGISQQLNSSTLVVGPVISAIKTVDKATANPGETLSYTVTISNTSTDAATNLGFTDDVDPNTTLVPGSLILSPIAANDQYSSLGNVGISVPAANGLLANDYTGSPAATLTAVSNAATTGGGSISIATDGSFTYIPAAGYTGNDTYQYTLSNTAGSDNGTVTIAVTGITWFINNNYAGAVADGRLSTPFKTIAAFQAVNDGVGLHPGNNQVIFVFESSTAYTGNLSLRDGQKLIGQDATGTLAAITGFTTPTYSSPALPVLNSGNGTFAMLNSTAASTPVVSLAGGASGSYTIRGIQISDKPADAASAGIAGTNFGTLNVSESSITGTGQALLLNTGTVNGMFASLSSTSGPSGISLTMINGTLTAAGSLVNNSTGVLMNGGTGSFTYDGAVSNSSTNLVNIQSKTGGTVDFNGAISSGAAAKGIALTNNTGAIIRFDGGLALNTGANNAFTASGGGTVHITQNNSSIVNTIVSTTGIGLQIANTTIGADGVSFRSISVNGASKGIILNTTGTGGFTITGQGTTAASGGTIQNVSLRGIELIAAQNISLNNIQLTNANTTDGGGAGVCDETNNIGCNAALYIKDASTVGLTQINITGTEEEGMNMNNVTGLVMNNCTVQNNGNASEEGALKLRNILGTSSISNSVFKNSAYRIAHLINTTGTAHLTISASSFINDATNTSLIKQDCFEMRTQSAATATLLISNSTFKRAGTKGVQVFAENTSQINMALTNSTVDKDGQLMAGVEVGSDQTAVMNANVDGNALISGDREVPLNVYSGATSTMQSTARNNVIQGGNNPDLNAFATLRGYADQQSNSKILFTNNTITKTDEQGILVASAGATSGGSISGQVGNNAINTQNIAPNQTLSGIEVRSFSGGAGANTNCSYVNGNSVTMLDGTRHFRVTAASATSAISLQGAVSASTAALWNSNSNIPTSPPAVVSVAQVPGSTITNGGAFTCPTPTNTVIPSSVVISQPLEEETILASNAIHQAKTIPAEKADLDETHSTGIPSTPVITTMEEQSPATVSATLSGENITVSGIGLPANKTVVIKFQVTVNDPFPDNVCSVSNQGSVSGDNFTSLLTDNDAVGGNGIQPTVTLIPVAPSISSCQSNINAGTDAASCTSLQNFSVTATGCPTPTITYTIHNTTTTITSPYPFPIGTTVVDVTASNGVGSDATCQFTVNISNPAPVVTSVTVPANGTYIAGDILSFTVNFDGAVVVTGTPYLSLTIGSESRQAAYVSGSGTSSLIFVYTVSNTDLDDNGISVGSLQLNGGTIKNSCSTNATLTLNSVGNSSGVLVDGIAPNVTVNQADGQSDPTSNTTIHFTAVFSEPITGFVSGDVTISGTALATNKIVTEVTPFDGTTFDIAVSGMSMDGTVIASIGSAVAMDAAGNPNNASTSTDNTVTYVADAPPTVVSISRYLPLTVYSNASMVTFRVIFSENVTGVDISDFSLAISGSVSASLGTVSAIDGSTYNVSVQSITGDGLLRLDLNSSGTGIQDNIGQDIPGGFTSGQSYIIDHTAPTLTSVSIASNNTNPTLAKPGDKVTVNFTASEGIETPSATIASHAATVTSLGGNSYKAEYIMTIGDIEGPVAFSISFSDLAGNAGTTVTATTNLSSVRFDKTAPVVSSITRHNPLTETTTSTTLTYRVTFSEAVTGADITDFSLSVSSPAGESITAIDPVSQQIYDITVTVSTFAGATLRLDLKSSGTGIRDLAGNDIAGGYTNGESYLLGAPPEITQCQANIVTNTDAGVCTASKNFSVTVAGSPTPVVVYSVAGQPITSPYTFPQGITTVDVSASNGIGTAATCSFTVTVTDGEAPVVSGLTASPSVLWPPDHKMKDIILSYTATDNCGCTPVITVSSNESTHGTGDGDKSPDWEIVSNTLIRLRAERGNGKDAREYTVRVTCTDNAGHPSSQETVVRVAHNITAPVSGNSFKIGSTVSFAGDFWDLPGNKHTGSWLIDESTTAKGTVTEPSGTKNGKVTGSYKFTSAGVYRLQMNVTDQDRVTSYANTNDDLEAIVVIYDPNGGYAHGGGYFQSPAGALRADPTATGKVSYGFTANYFKTATYPKGETQFAFQVGDFEFNALNFEYLVVDGARAQLKGTGKITGDQSGINFILTVIDGALDGTGIDKIRMKIYNKNTGYVYYDNQPGLSDADDPTQPVAGKSTIVIGGSDSNSGGSGGGGKPIKTLLSLQPVVAEPVFKVSVLPNPSRSTFNIQISSTNTTAPVVMQVFDLYGRMIESRKMTVPESLQIGDRYRPGSYIVRLLQDGKQKEFQLIKLAD